jgi:hypothetical protein
MRQLGASPEPEEIVKIKRIIDQDPLTPISKGDRALIWRFRHFIVSSPAALPKFLQCHEWTDRFQVQEMHRLLKSWSPLKPISALELLDAKYADEHIRACVAHNRTSAARRVASPHASRGHAGCRYAVRCLEGISDAELADLVLQLTQVLYIAYAMLCCAVLCCAVLCCAVLCCAVLCYAMLCYAMLCYADAGAQVRGAPRLSPRAHAARSLARVPAPGGP